MYSSLVILMTMKVYNKYVVNIQLFMPQHSTFVLIMYSTICLICTQMLNYNCTSNALVLINLQKISELFRIYPYLSLFLPPSQHIVYCMYGLYMYCYTFQCKFIMQYKIVKCKSLTSYVPATLLQIPLCKVRLHNRITTFIYLISFGDLNKYKYTKGSFGFR